VNFLISAGGGYSRCLQSHAPGTYLGWLKDTVGNLVPKHILDESIKKWVLKPYFGLGIPG
jgi:hypothetical protein